MTCSKNCPLGVEPWAVASIYIKIEPFFYFFLFYLMDRSWGNYFQFLSGSAGK